jgi:hypothetical protein
MLELPVRWDRCLAAKSFCRLVFTETAKGAIAAESDKANCENHKEIFVSDVIQAAIVSKLRLEAVIFPEGTFVDVGIPYDPVRAIHIHSKEKALK